MGRRFERTERNKFLCTGVKSFDEFIDALESHVTLLKVWRSRGIMLDTEGGGIEDDYATFYTEDEVLARILEFESQDEWS